jgi:predicted dehydrogenase
VEDEVHANITFASGLSGTADISWSETGYRLPEIRLEIHGTNGWIIVSDDYVSIQTNAGVNGVIEAGKHVFQKPEFNTNVDFLLAEPEYTMEDRAFMEAVQAGSQIEPSFQTAAKVNDFVDMIHQNAKLGSIS